MEKKQELNNEELEKVSGGIEPSDLKKEKDGIVLITTIKEKPPLNGPGGVIKYNDDAD